MVIHSNDLNKDVEFDNIQISQIIDAVIELDAIEEIDAEYSTVGECDMIYNMFGSMSPIFDNKDNIMGFRIGPWKQEEISFGWPEEITDIFDFDYETFFYMMTNEEWSLSVRVDYDYEEGWYDSGDYWNPPEGEPTQITSCEVSYIALVDGNGNEFNITDMVDKETKSGLCDYTINLKSEDICNMIDDRN